VSPARLLLLALAASSSLPACAYRLGPAAPLAGASTVAIPVFENRTYRRGVEMDLARLVSSELLGRSRLRLVETGADLVVDGAIVTVEESVLSEAEDQVIRESSVLVTVEFTVRDGRTGEPVVPVQKVTERESFVPGIGESIRTARAEALKRLAADIVDRLEAR
jgi:hypothetical protein